MQARNNNNNKIRPRRLRRRRPLPTRRRRPLLARNAPRRPMRRVRRRARPVRRNIINTKNFSKRMRVIKTNSTSMVVSGLDLVYSIPDVSINKGSKVLTIIPSNPAYWTGTRISSMALGYQQYRPLKFVVHYVPIVSAMQQGNIFGGTIWNNVTIAEENLQQTLVTSSGGMSTQVFCYKSSNVRCKDNLSRNLYNIGGQLDEESNPFYYIAIGVGNFKDDERVTPGYFWISYTYSFKNPIGNNQVYTNLGIAKLDEIDYKLNTTAMLCNYKEYKVGNMTKKLNMFSSLQIDQRLDGGLIATYNGDFVDVTDDDKLWIFQNYPLDSKNQKVIKRYQIEVDRNKQIQPTNDYYIVPQFEYSLFKFKNNTLFIYYTNDTNVHHAVADVEWAYKLANNELPQFDEINPHRLSSTFSTTVIAEMDVPTGTMYIKYQMYTEDHFINVKVIPDENENQRKNIHNVRAKEKEDIYGDDYEDYEYDEYEDDCYP